MPSVAYDSQSRLVNRIYFAIDDPRRPASHLTGPLATAGGGVPAGGLLMIPGPLALNWSQRVAGVLPKNRFECHRLPHAAVDGALPALVRLPASASPAVPSGSSSRPTPMARRKRTPR